MPRAIEKGFPFEELHRVAALESWRLLIRQRARGEPGVEEPGQTPHALKDYLRGQRARLEGQPEEAARAYRAALASPAAQPFARYGLACLGEDDFQNVLQAEPGLFLGLRCRARLVLERFRQRQPALGSRG